MAYRGRVLVELSTQLDGKIDKNVEDICSDDILVAQVCKVTFPPLLIWPSAGGSRFLPAKREVCFRLSSGTRLCLSVKQTIVIVADTL